MKIGPTYINIIQSIKPYKIGIENNKKTYYVEANSINEVINEIKSILKTSNKHLENVTNYIVKSLDNP